MKIQNLVRASLLSLIVFVGTGSLAGCTINNTPAAPSVPASTQWNAIVSPGSVAGTALVTVSSNLSSITSVRVALAGQSRDIPAGGAFTFTNLPEGTYTVQGSALDKDGKIQSSKELGSITIKEGSDTSTGSSSLTASARLDGKVPVVSYSSKGGDRLRIYFGTTASPPLVQEFSKFDGSGEYRGPALTGTGYWKTELEKGGSIVSVNSGSLSTSVASDTVSDLSITSLQTSSVTESSVRVYAFAEGAKRLRVEVDGRVYSTDGESADRVIPDLADDTQYQVTVKAYREDGSFVERTTSFRTKTTSSNDDSGSSNDSLGSNRASSTVDTNSQDAGISAIEVRRQSDGKYRFIVKTNSAWNGRNLVMAVAGFSGTSTKEVSAREAYWVFERDSQPFDITIRYNGQVVYSGELDLSSL